MATPDNTGKHYNIGNNFAEGCTTSGRPRSFQSNEEINELFEGYKAKQASSKFIKRDFIKNGARAGELIEITIDRPLTIEGFCVFAGISFQTFQNYINDPSNEFFETLTHIRETIKQNQLEGALSGVFDANIVSRLNGLKDRTDVTTNDEAIQCNISFQSQPET